VRRTDLDRRVVAVLLLAARVSRGSGRERGLHQSRRLLGAGRDTSAPRASEPRAGAWEDRFTSALRRIAANQRRGLPPAVVARPGLANVGTHAGKVMVDPVWMERVSRSICGEQASCRDDLVHGIAAHEWSHATGGHAASAASSSHARELAADRDAGRELGSSGASPQPLIALLEAGSQRESASHPSSTARTAAILAGYQEGQSMGCDANRCSCGAPTDASTHALTGTPPAPRGSRVAAGRGTS